MQRMKWGTDTTIWFLKLYKEHECLWNLKSLAYKDKQTRDAAISDISNKMGIEGFGNAEIKSKIRILRSTYYQEKKKIQNSEITAAAAGTSEIYRPNIQWYNDMDEIITQIERKPPANDYTVYMDATTCDTSETQNEDQEQTTPTAAPTPSNPHPKLVYKQRKIIKSPTSKNTKLNKIATIVKDLRTMNRRHEETEFDIFGLSVAAQLKKLTESEALIAQEQIQSILTRSRLNDMRSRSSFQTYSVPLSSSNSWSTVPVSPRPQSASSSSTGSAQPVDD